MKEKYNINQITKTLDKLFKAGYITEKLILGMQMEDLLKIPSLTTVETHIIIEFKKAIKEKRIIAFFSSNYAKEKEGNDFNEKI